MSQPQRVKVAAAQLAPMFMDARTTAEKACQAILEAGENGAQLVVLPEAFIPTYPYHAQVLDSLSMGKFDRQLFEEAVEIPGPITDMLGAAAKQAGCVAVVGLSERDGGTLYNTQLFVAEDGRILGKHRKLMPTRFERMVWGRGDGRDLQVFPTSVGTVGGLICFEHSNALYRYALQAQGEQIHIASWPGGMPRINHIIDAAIRHYAFEGQAFVINVTALMTDEIISALGEGGSVDRYSPGGGFSAIVNPWGEYIAGPEEEKEGLIYADIDLSEISRWKILVDSAGHYARPDVVRLVLNRKPQTPLEIEE